MTSSKPAEFAHLGKTLAIRGELSGSEDLYIDGRLEGSIELTGKDLRVGPSGQIRASERAELKRSAVAVGDIAAQRVAIEEGAYYKGKINTDPAKSAGPDTTS